MQSLWLVIERTDLKFGSYPSDALEEGWINKNAESTSIFLSDYENDISTTMKNLLVYIKLTCLSFFSRNPSICVLVLSKKFTKNTNYKYPSDIQMLLSLLEITIHFLIQNYGIQLIKLWNLWVAENNILFYNKCLNILNEHSWVTNFSLCWPVSKTIYLTLLFLALNVISLLKNAAISCNLVNSMYQIMD